MNPARRLACSLVLSLGLTLASGCASEPAPARSGAGGTSGGERGEATESGGGASATSTALPPAETCDRAACGPAPRMPARQCPDGSRGGNTGRCLRRPDGSCGWEIRDCPTP